MMEFEWEGSGRRTTVRFRPPEEQPDLKALFSGEWKKPFLVVDTAVRRLWDGMLQPAILSSSGLYVMEAGEALKNTFTLTQIWDSMFSARTGRDTPVAVVGGGLVCDMGALAASTYMRGLRTMLIPTTLLCMVDACLGGKTGVNLSGAKNQVGTFAPAEMVYISTAFLQTLPEREFRGGMAEIVKTALVGDRSIAVRLEKYFSSDDRGGILMDIIENCLRVKGSIVEKDLTEKGGRMVLNLGHTVGHALESASSFQLSHGEAVGLGMLAEAAMAVSLGGSRQIPGEIQHLLKSAGLPVSLDRSIPQEELEELFRRDKKTGSGGRVWALPFDWGDCRLVRLTAEEEDELLPGALNLLRV